MEQRLQKLLAAAGVGSRRHCETLIATGRVTVNGRVVTELGARADPETDVVAVDGRVLQPQRKVYLLCNKPVGYASTRRDPHARHTVLDLVKDQGAYLYPAGRLDVDTSGLLILTNDGDLTQLLTHPSHEIEKTYRAVVRGRISASSLDALERGVELDDGVTAPARVRLISYDGGTNTSTCEITIHEGRKRQVRRMFAAVGHRVEELSRVRLGNLTLKGLAQGRCRELTPREINDLRKLARGASEPHARARSRGSS